MVIYFLDRNYRSKAVATKIPQDVDTNPHQDLTSAASRSSS